MSADRVTLSDIAKLVNLSPRAVSAALHGNGRVNPQKAAQVRSIAEQLGYQPNIMARGLMNGCTYLLGVVLPNVYDSFYPSVLQGIEDAAQRQGYRVIVCSAGWNPEAEEAHIADLLRRGVDGLIVDPARGTKSIYKRLEKSAVPYVQIFHRADVLSGPSITVDNIAGAAIAVRHLIESTGTLPLFLPGEPGWPEADSRLTGFTKAMRDAGAKPTAIRKHIYGRRTETWNQGVETMRDLLNKGTMPRAIFAVNDFAALGVLSVAYEHRIAVPDALAVAVFDDLDIASRQTGADLTTVRQPKHEIGELAVNTLLRRINGEEVNDMLLTPNLIVRQSTPNLKQPL